MNNLQKIASNITGYEGGTDYLREGAKDDYYYSLTSEQEKLAQIKMVAENVCNISDVQEKQIKEIYEYVEQYTKDMLNSNETYHAFQSLGN